MDIKDYNNILKLEGSIIGDNTTSNNIWTYDETYYDPYTTYIKNKQRDTKMTRRNDDDDDEVKVESKSKYVPIEVLSRESLNNHFTIRSNNLYDIREDKLVGNIINFLEKEVEGLYSYVERNFFGKECVDLYFELESDLDMLVQYVVQWKLEMIEDDEEEEKDNRRDIYSNIIQHLMQQETKLKSPQQHDEMNKYQVDYTTNKFYEKI